MTTDIAKAIVGRTTLEIQVPLELADQVVFQGSGEVVSEHTINNQDGTVTRSANVKVAFLELKKVGNSGIDQTIAQDIVKHKSQSKALRDLAYRISQETGENPDQLYTQAVEAAREFLQNHLDEIKGY